MPPLPLFASRSPYDAARPNETTAPVRYVNASSEQPSRRFDDRTRRAASRAGEPSRFRTTWPFVCAARSSGRDSGGGGGGATIDNRARSLARSLLRPAPAGRPPTSVRDDPSRERTTTRDRYFKPTLRQAWPREYPRPQFAFKISMFNVSCNSHYFTQLAALFIDLRAE